MVETQYLKRTYFLVVSGKKEVDLIIRGFDERSGSVNERSRAERVTHTDLVNKFPDAEVITAYSPFLSAVKKTFEQSGFNWNRARVEGLAMDIY